MKTQKKHIFYYEKQTFQLIKIEIEILGFDLNILFIPQKNQKKWHKK